MTASAEPTTNYLREIVLDSNRDLPLHAQLRKALEQLIIEHFDDQSRFYSESQLISNLRVSQGTVRRALADLASRGMLEKRQARCTLVCKQSPSVSMRNLAVFLPDYTSQSVAKLLSHFNAECQNRGIRMQPIYTHRGERLIKAYNNLNFSPQEGGVVLLGNSPRATVELEAALGEKGYDCVVVGTVIKGSTGKFVGGSSDSIMKLGLRHLVDLGHRRIALMVNEPAELESIQERIRAFQAWVSASEQTLTTRVINAGAQLWDDAYEFAKKAMEEVMKSGEPPTAIFAVSDVGALGVIHWLQQRGYRVPLDISVMGIGGIKLGTMVHPTLTTIEAPAEEFTKGIFRLLTDPENSVRKLLLPPRLIARDSTAGPAQ